MNALCATIQETSREEIDLYIADGDMALARASLSRLWEQERSPALAGFVESRFDRLRPQMNLPVCRIMLLRSFTVEPVIPLLRAAAFSSGLDLEVQTGDFNAYAQEMLDPESNLYRFGPDIAVLAVQARDVAPDLWNDFADLSPGEVEGAIERVAGEFRNWIEAFRAHSQAHLIVHTLETPATPSNGLLDAQVETGQRESIRRINHELARLARVYSGIYVLDYDSLIARYGGQGWHDERKWLTMRMPLSAGSLMHIAGEWLRFIHPLMGRTCKVLVTDLDNTLWGGVIGEDGLSGIKLGPEYPGAAYQSLQRAIMDLYRRGIILAVCSKNNPSDAMEAIEKHPGMLISPQHFATLRINWNDKAQNLQEIADELNVGTDALALLDDSPAECEWIRVRMPEVTVIQLPGDPMDYARAVRDCPAFERLSLSAEDRKRGIDYAQQRRRAELKASASSLEDFYRSLSLEVEVFEVTRETLSRVAQLTQKTNQFNMTTRRYSEQQIAEMAASPDWRVYSMRARDRFGDNGLVGVAITRFEESVCEIDTFLLSCRVIGRRLETALLASVAEHARAEGARRLVGRYFPTAKNGQVKDFYKSHGFVNSAVQDGQSCWEFDLDAGEIQVPDWINRRTLE
ncbi:MAG: HAD-IIIC family phosphatase [Blastocatellia bacterium]|nr:HAD-IIIC family phosphatase [Blastocatellia bacterium]